MNQQIQNTVDECKRQQESCLYTSVMLFEWLKELRIWRGAFVVVPIVLGSLATLPILANRQDLEWLTAICAMLAGVIPAIYKALDLDVSLKTIADNACAFKVLHDRFRQAWNVVALGSPEDFSAHFNDLMNRMDEARSATLTPPERFFEKARKKIVAGDYSFEVDSK